MTARLLTAGLMLMAVPCAFSQSTPAPAAPSGPAPIVRPHVRPDDRARHDDRDHRGMPGGEMHGGPGGHLLPEGTWWRSPEVAARIGLTADQQKHIDDIFLQSRVQLIDMHAALDKEQLLLEPLLNANPVDQGKALAQISKIADTRADLEKTNAKMLLSIRAVLNADQWTKLRERHEVPRGGEMRGREWHGGGDGQHGPMMGRGPGGPGGQQPPPQ